MKVGKGAQTPAQEAKKREGPGVRRRDVLEKSMKGKGKSVATTNSLMGTGLLEAF